MTDTGGSLSGVTKRYSRRRSWVLERIDLELPPGSTTVIVGGNGSGKSTLLRIAAGVSWPSKGRVRLPQQIGYVPERLAARTRFTGAEYLAHMGRIKGLPPGVVRARSRELLQQLDLRPGPDEAIDSLSKGNRQKLVLAQAFLGAAGLLVFDEPFNGLDPVGRMALEDLMQEARSTGTALLVSSHRFLPRQPGLRQLRIERGRLVEVDLKEGSEETDAGVMEIRLRATEDASDGYRLVSISGVSHARVDPQFGPVLLMTDRAHIDSVLLEVIARGWSVCSVRSVLQGDDPPE
jgi:ABC-2 type transport system ATP-binding protein